MLCIVNVNCVNKHVFRSCILMTWIMLNIHRYIYLGPDILDGFDIKSSVPFVDWKLYSTVTRYMNSYTQVQTGNNSLYQQVGITQCRNVTPESPCFYDNYMLLAQNLMQIIYI